MTDQTQPSIRDARPTEKDEMLRFVTHLLNVHHGTRCSAVYSGGVIEVHEWRGAEAIRFVLKAER